MFIRSIHLCDVYLIPHSVFFFAPASPSLYRNSSLFSVYFFLCRSVSLCSIAVCLSLSRDFQTEWALEIKTDFNLIKKHKILVCYALALPGSRLFNCMNECFRCSAVENTALEHLIENLRWMGILRRMPCTGAVCVYWCAVCIWARPGFSSFSIRLFIIMNEILGLVGKQRDCKHFCSVCCDTHTHTLAASERERERYGTHLVYFRILSLSFSFIVFIDFSLRFLITRQLTIGARNGYDEDSDKRSQRAWNGRRTLFRIHRSSATLTEFVQSASGMRANKTWHTDEKEM